LNTILSNDEVSLEDKISQIIAEHDADTRGIVQNRDKFQREYNDAKKQIEVLGTEKSGYDARIAELEDTLKKASTDNTATKEYWQSQFDSQLKAKDADYAKLHDDYANLKNSFYTKLKNEAVQDAVKDFVFLDGLKGGFVASLLYNNQFEAKDIDGETIFLNKNNKTIAEVAKDFALTNEGKAYLKNPSAGGGAKTDYTSSSRVNTMTRAEYEAKNRENPLEVREFLRKGGTIIDN